MKVIFPIALALILAACSDSGKAPSDAKSTAPMAFATPSTTGNVAGRAMARPIAMMAPTPLGRRFDARRFDARKASPAAFPPWGNRTHADLNGDGRSDVLWENPSIPAMAYWLMDGPRVIGSGAFWIAPGYRIAATGDFDGNGLHDILWDSPVISGQTRNLYVWHARADGGFDARYVEIGFGLGERSRPTRVADFDGDGKPDLLIQHTPVPGPFISNTYVVIMLENLVNRRNSGNASTIIGDGDLLGLGKAQSLGLRANYSTELGRDLYSLQPEQDDPQTGVMTRNALFSLGHGPAEGAESRLIGTGDLNADGIPDLTWYNPTSGGIETMILTRTPSLSIAQHALLPTDTAYRVVAMGDYDGDGYRDDILWDRTVSNELYMWIGRNNGLFDYVYVGDYAAGWTVSL